ncbi:hypothetical protein BS78_06G033200, partial [Paspalum vaginatum]
MDVSPNKAAPASLPAGWSSAPPELLDLVLRRLFSAADRVRFAAVCRHWHDVASHYSSAPRVLPPALPWLNFPHDGHFQSLPDGEQHMHSFSGHSKDVRCVGTFGRWLLFEELGVEPGRRYFLRDPLVPSSHTPLPGHCKEPVDLTDNGRSPGWPWPRWPFHSAAAGSGSTRFYIAKVIVCSGDLIVAMVCYKRDPRYYRGDVNVVVCCRPGMSSWSAGLWNGRWYRDMVLYKGKLYAVDEKGELFAHEITEDRDTGEPRVSRVWSVVRTPPPPLSKYMPDGSYCAHNSLLMVRWIVPKDDYTAEDSTKQMEIMVFEADFETGRWVEVKSLDDQVLFVSSDSSKSRAIYPSGHRHHCDYLRGNGIYFVDDVGGMHLSDQVNASWFFPR